MAAEEGLKYDADKPRMDLIPPELLIEMGKVLDYGAKKYAERNWEKGFAWGRAHAAAMRHMAAWSRGENLDPETGLPHLAHAATNMAFLLAFQLRNVGTDDRTKAFEPAEPVIRQFYPLPPDFEKEMTQQLQSIRHPARPVVGTRPVRPMETQ